MILNAAQDYALRMCAYLARNGGTASSREIAEGVPGKHGGYRLAKPAGDISALSVVDAAYDGSNRAMGHECARAEVVALCALGGLTLEEVAS